MIYSIAYLFMGTAVFSSACFTSLGNGKIPAVISVLRALVLEVGTILLIPLVWNIDGV